MEKNRIQCLSCNSVIESKYGHDFVTCKCGDCSVDGGPGWGGRLLYKNMNMIKFLPTDNEELNNKETEKRQQYYKDYVDNNYTNKYHVSVVVEKKDNSKD